MNLKLTAVVMAIALTGCAATGDDYVTGVRPTVAMHPVLGQLTISESDLLGPDADQNGVRDEIDAMIRTTFAQDSQRSIATRYALDVSKAMIAGSNDVTPSEEEKREYVAAMVCLNGVKKGAASTLLAQSTRTKNRAQAMGRWHQLAGKLPYTPGSVCGEPSVQYSGVVRDLACGAGAVAVHVDYKDDPAYAGMVFKMRPNDSTYCMRVEPNLQVKARDHVLWTVNEYGVRSVTGIKPV